MKKFKYILILLLLINITITVAKKNDKGFAMCFGPEEFMFIKCNKITNSDSLILNFESNHVFNNVFYKRGVFSDILEKIDSLGQPIILSGCIFLYDTYQPTELIGKIIFCKIKYSTKSRKSDKDYFYIQTVNNLFNILVKPKREILDLKIHKIKILYPYKFTLVSIRPYPYNWREFISE